jgi:hypothetical protein
MQESLGTLATVKINCNLFHRFDENGQVMLDFTRPTPRENSDESIAPPHISYP